jgi:hypothetical protein
MAYTGGTKQQEVTMNNLVTVPAISPQEFCGEGWRILEEKPETKALTSWDPTAILFRDWDNNNMEAFGLVGPQCVSFGFRHLVFYQQKPEPAIERLLGVRNRIVFPGTTMVDPHNHQGFLVLCLLSGKVLWRFCRFR